MFDKKFTALLFVSSAALCSQPQQYQETQSRLRAKLAQSLVIQTTFNRQELAKMLHLFGLHNDLRNISKVIDGQLLNPEKKGVEWIEVQLGQIDQRVKKARNPGRERQAQYDAYNSKDSNFLDCLNMCQHDFANMQARIRQAEEDVLRFDSSQPEDSSPADTHSTRSDSGCPIF